MKKETIIAGLVGLLIGIFIVPIFSPIMPSMWGNRTMYQNNMMGRNQMLNQVDAHFIEQMIPHHEDAITMANIALTQAEHQEIKTLANAIVSAQSAEITQMKTWYRSWFDKDVPASSFNMGHSGGMMHMGMMGNNTDITTLQNAKPFDKAFIENMIPHHQMAVMMAQMLSRGTTRPEMKQLAQNIISSQTKEINDMRSWYQTWYLK